MSESSRKALAALTPTQLAHERLATLECAVHALIATHPDTVAVREAFDALYRKHQLSRIQAGAPPETSEALRALIRTLFGS